MDTISFQIGLFQIKADLKLKEHKTSLQRLSDINNFLIISGLEEKCILSFLKKKEAEKQAVNNMPEARLTVKELKRFTHYASEAVRCNILAHEFKLSNRCLSRFIAYSEIVQRFLFAGDISRRNIPGKTKVNDFLKIFSIKELKALSDSFIMSLFDVFCFLKEYSVETASRINSNNMNTMIYQLTGVSVGS